VPDCRLALLAAVLAACASAPQARTSEQTAAPVARKEPHVTQINGDTLRDDYFWLRNKGTPEVESYLNAEAAYADAIRLRPHPWEFMLYYDL